MNHNVKNITKWLYAVLLFGNTVACMPLGGIHRPDIAPAGSFKSEGYLSPGYYHTRYRAFEGRDDAGRGTGLHEETDQNWVMNGGFGLRFAPVENVELNTRLFGPWPGGELGVRVVPFKLGAQAVSIGSSFGRSLPVRGLYDGYSFIAPSLSVGSDSFYVTSLWFLPYQDKDYGAYTGLGVGRRIYGHFFGELLLYRNLTNRADQFGEVTWFVVPSIGVLGPKLR